MSDSEGPSSSALETAIQPDHPVVDRWTQAQDLPLLGNQFIVSVARAQLLSPDEAAGALSGIQNGQNAEILDERVAAAVSEANDAHFRFDLRELHHRDGPTLETWPGERQSR